MARQYPINPVTPFANSATANPGGVAQPGSKQAGSPNYTTNVTTLQALAAWANGLSGVTVTAPGTNGSVPPLEELNGILKVISYGVASMLECGIPDWNPGITYSTNSMVQYNGIVYQSLIDANLNTIPTTHPTQWQLFQNGNAPIYWGGTDTGTLGSNAYKISVSNFPTSNPNIITGSLIFFNVGTTGPNTSSCTLQVNSNTAIGIKTIQNYDFSGGGTGGQGELSGLVGVVYDGTYFRVVTPYPTMKNLNLQSVAAGTYDNYALPGISRETSSVWFGGSLSADIIFTGFDNTVVYNGQRILLMNMDPTHNVVLKNQNTGSNFTNRFLFNAGTDYTIAPGHFTYVFYSSYINGPSVVGRWGAILCE